MVGTTLILPVQNSLSSLTNMALAIAADPSMYIFLVSHLTKGCRISTKLASSFVNLQYEAPKKNDAFLERAGLYLSPLSEFFP